MSDSTEAAITCNPTVGQAFLDEDDLWLASCPCGWVNHVRTNYALAVFAAQDHAGSASTEADQ